LRQTRRLVHGAPAFVGGREVGGDEHDVVVGVGAVDADDAEARRTESGGGGAADARRGAGDDGVLGRGVRQRAGP
jgi:hypothetical protein